jgi:hypothetical protein
VGVLHGVVVLAEWASSTEVGVLHGVVVLNGVAVLSGAVVPTECPSSTK